MPLDPALRNHLRQQELSRTAPKQHPLLRQLEGPGPSEDDFPPLNQFGELKPQQQLSPRAAQMQSLELGAARQEAERRFPYIKRFGLDSENPVEIAFTKVPNKGGMGELVEPRNPANPRPGRDTITIGENSKKLQGGIADSIAADMVHVAGRRDKQFQELKIKLAQKMSPAAIALARRRYEEETIHPETGERLPPYKEFSGSGFATFEKFLNSFWIEGTVQHLLFPENSEIEGIRRMSPDANATLDEIKQLFEGD